MNWEIALSVLGGVGFGGVLNTFISYILESRKDKRYYEREQHRLAFEFYQYISSLMDKRLYRMRRIKYLKNPGSTLDYETVRREYTSIITEWNDSLNSNIAKIGVFFNSGLMEKFEKDLSPRFVTIGGMGEKILTDADDAIEPNTYWQLIDELNAQTQQFDRMLLRAWSAQKTN